MCILRPRTAMSAATSGVTNSFNLFWLMILALKAHPRNLQPAVTREQMVQAMRASPMNRDLSTLRLPMPSSLMRNGVLKNMAVVLYWEECTG